ncbi:zinc ribbon domain-containing protein [Mycobacterium sp. shizuoka-1]|uniref:zinc ribbon domain-containing protein n=1 Tax=Mycobacterium sp. shizuoka-1 TaxID=2039281 RepID=UPI000C05E823|nr:zinc ribbon domain-containing protein [Mycobacterium sp. shizuoka-1]GAY15392.1 hypothetical protein MSZK_21180 [Mycobacterium sp. shizuoka-1]
MTEDVGHARHQATMPCPACHHDVPAGRFCAHCGGQLSPAVGGGPTWLRVRHYAAAPGEHVLQPSIVSSVFPHLPQRSRGAFRLGLALVAVLLVSLSLTQWYIPMIAVAIFAPTVLVALYLHETGLLGDLPRWLWVLTAVLGLSVGIAWAVLTRSIVAESYSLGLGAEIPTLRLIGDAVVIPFGALLSIQIPAVIVRMMRPPVSETLHGFVIGLIGATMFTVATNVVRMVPQFGETSVAGDQPVPAMLLEAGVRGVAEPLTGLSLGGLVGAALWYQGRRRRNALLIGGLGLLIGSAAYASVGLAQAYRLPVSVQFLIHITFAAVAIVALRVGLQIMMLRENAEVYPELPILCPSCEHVVPDTRFCASCGVSCLAAPTTSRVARRRERPQPALEAVDR